MKKQLVFVSGIILTILVGLTANAKDQSARENFYFKSSDSINENNTVSFGYRPLYNEGLLKKARFEQELSHNKSVVNNYSQNKTKFMSNLIYDFDKSHGFTPYIGAGVGVSHTSYFDENEESKTTPAYQIVTGLSYEPEKHPSIKLQMGYSYLEGISSESAGNDLHLKQDNHDEGGHAVAAFLQLKF